MKSLTKSEITLEILKSFVYLEDFEISYASSSSGKPLGFFTNYSLCTTAATRLFEARLDEQLIMLRTGHRSTAGVRSYKRTTSMLKERHPMF